MTRLFAAFVAIAGLASLAGCGGGSSDDSDVSGTVNIDGKPLAEGQIIFESADGSKAPAAGTIKAGQYSLKTAPGVKKVKITATRPGKKVDPMMGAAPQEALIGPDYNSATKLTAEVKPGKNADVNFEVKALP
ncbi:MAG: hypothetical protein K8U57_02775 [Planctomycetes bacterium]|nr:hypothetical protein [Planctomycetota bacterium]